MKTMHMHIFQTLFTYTPFNIMSEWTRKNQFFNKKIC